MNNQAPKKGSLYVVPLEFGPLPRNLQNRYNPKLQLCDSFTLGILCCTDFLSCQHNLPTICATALELTYYARTRLYTGENITKDRA